MLGQPPHMMMSPMAHTLMFGHQMGPNPMDIQAMALNPMQMVRPLGGPLVGQSMGLMANPNMIINRP
jgi:hypothetical protein